MNKTLIIAALPLLLVGCGRPVQPAAPRAHAATLAARDMKAEPLVELAGTITGRIERSDGFVGAITVGTKDGEQTVYLTEKTALSWDPRVKAVRAPASFDLKVGTRVEALAAVEKNRTWGPATWLSAKQITIMVGE